MCRDGWWGLKHYFQAVDRHSACGSKTAFERDASLGEHARGALEAPTKGVQLVSRKRFVMP
jgi:hypothetical protein